MKISVSFGSDNDLQPSNKKKRCVHKKPWFWLLIILIVSVAFKITSRNQQKILFLETENDDCSSDFSFEPKTNNFNDEKNITENNENEEFFESNENIDDEDQKAVTENKNSRSIFHFILNISTKKYHTKDCSAVKKLAGEKRMDTDIEADSLKEAQKIIESQGYDLCGLCDR